MEKLTKDLKENGAVAHHFAKTLYFCLMDGLCMNPVRHIPNSLTCMNLLSGSVAVICIFSGMHEAAGYCIVAAAVFDFLDGFAARLLHAYSPIGKELDSLADMVSFGLAPSLMMYCLLQNAWGGPQPGTCGWWLSLSALLIAVCSALRLARFNIDTRQATSFIGLPTPACALFIMGLARMTPGSGLWGARLTGSPVWLLVCTGVFSWLLVSPLSMFSLKFKSWKLRDNRLVYAFLLLSLLLLVTQGTAGFMPVILLYIALSCIKAVLSQK